MRRLLFGLLLFVLVLVSCAKQSAQLPTMGELSARTSAAGTQIVTVFKAPT